jgi:hypothetical protein
VAADVAAVLGGRVTFEPSDEAKWYRCRDGSQVEFELVPADPTMSEPATRIRRDGGQIHRVFVFPLSTPSSPYQHIFWVSWHETWLKQDSTDYVLLSAGWTMFEGLSGNQAKHQVLRVEWDQLPDRRSKRAGHPHWHFDHELFVSAEPGTVEVAPGLVEITTDAPFTRPKQAAVGFIHLAMGAWNRDNDHPECWQRTYEGDCGQLRDWCVKTLKYLREQVG